jgi:hypothetical protein
MSPGGFVIRGFGFNSHRFRRIRVQGLGFRDLVQVAGGRVFLLFMYEVWRFGVYVAVAEELHGGLALAGDGARAAVARQCFGGHGAREAQVRMCACGGRRGDGWVRKGAVTLRVLLPRRI